MQMTTDEHITELMRLLIMMDLKKKEIFEIAAAMETTEMLKRFLDKLSAKNYDMTPEEVYHRNILIEKDSWIIRDTAFVKRQCKRALCKQQ